MLIAIAGLILYPVGMKKLNQTYPNLAVETVNIPTDADAIARGRHIAAIWASGYNFAALSLAAGVLARAGIFSRPQLARC